MGTFLNQGGKLLLSTAAQDTSPVTSNFFELSPIDSLMPVPANTTNILWDTSTMQPNSTVYPVFAAQRFCFYRSPHAVCERHRSALPSQHFIARCQFPVHPLLQGRRDIMGMRTNASNGSKFVIATLELHRLNADNNIDQLLRRILRTEFGI